VVNASRLKAYVEAEGADPSCVYLVPNVVYPASPRPRDETRLAHDLPLDRPLCLLVASVRPVKNHELALRVASRLRTDPSRPLLVLVGSRTDAAPMRARVEADGLADVVRLLGHSDDVPSLLAAGDVALLTSKTEGLPNALLEAAIAGLPSVSTDCGGAGEVLVDGETGYIVGVDDDVAMAARISELLGDTSKRHRMGAAATRHVSQRHAPDRVAKTALAAYRDACARRNHRV
jgi:glycosyltransferase involved in cell wall biosynthesis